VTWTQQVDLGGAIPKWVVNRQGVSTLMYVIERLLLVLRPHPMPNPPLAPGI
jgi:hypothetical protein